MSEPGSVAVMLFKNLSNDEEQEYFCEGFTEDLLSMLSRYNKLVVISSHASFAYKEKNKNFQEIGKELGVKYIIHGSVRKLGPKCVSMRRFYQQRVMQPCGQIILIYLLMKFLMCRMK